MKPVQFSLLFVLPCFATRMAGQTNYYTANKTFVEDGYKYQCDVDASGLVRASSDKKQSGLFL